MKINVLLFAEARERVGEASINLELENNATIGLLKKILVEKFPDLETLVAHSAFSRNQQFAADDALLIDEDEVAMIPPVSGG